MGQGSTKREGGRGVCQEIAKGVLKAWCVWKDSANIGMGTIVASMLSWKPRGPHFDS